MANALPRGALSGDLGIASPAAPSHPRAAGRGGTHLAGAPATGQPSSGPADDPEAAFRVALGGGAAPALTADGRDARHRIAVYRNGIVSSLADALEAAFPVTRDLVGAEMFRAAAIAHARGERPASPVLHRWGERFADLLAALPGLAPYPFVPEVARIEFARIAATHAADASPLDPAALAGAPDPGAIRFLAHPATRLVPTPAGGLAAWRKSGGEAAVEAAAALVTRPAMAVLVTPLSAGAGRLAARLLAGDTLAEAADADVAVHLAALLSAGTFAGAAPSP